MKKNLVPLLAFSALFAACAPAPTPRPLADRTREIGPPLAYSATESALFDALNAARREAGKPALKYSAKLTSFAQSASGSAASAGDLLTDSPAELRLHSGFDSLGRIQGVLKDRGPSTGSAFVGYWKKDSQEMMDGNWSAAGVGVSKAPDGRLFAVVLLGSGGE